MGRVGGGAVADVAAVLHTAQMDGGWKCARSVDIRMCRGSVVLQVRSRR